MLQVYPDFISSEIYMSQIGSRRHCPNLKSSLDSIFPLGRVLPISTIASMRSGYVCRFDEQFTIVDGVTKFPRSESCLEAYSEPQVQCGSV